MMEIQIKNFGPISEANIRIGGLTIFAGANNTGKSFTSRLVYSILNSLQSDLYIEHAGELLNSLHPPNIIFHLDDLSGQRQTSRRKINEIISRIGSKVQTLEPSEIFSREFTTLLESTRIDLENHLSALRPRKPSRSVDEIIQLLDSYLKQLAIVQRQVSQKNTRDNFTKVQLRSNIERELTGNFCVPSIASLIGAKRSTPIIKFIGNSNNISFTLEQSDRNPRVKVMNADVGQYYPSNWFLESPSYWKMGAGILRKRFSRSFADSYDPKPRRTVSELPAYVYSLRSSLLSEYTGEIAFPDILDWINEKNAFNGRLVVAAGGQLLYEDGHRQYPLQTTATGITNIGIIGLLIERKLINERTVLFLDEPESNLHPAWQVLMSELLLKLAQAGVGVIFATHSIDILKYIEVSTRRDPEIVDLINLYHFPHLADSDTNFVKRIRRIQDDLSDPYYRMYIGDI